jgi:hypothetical protein
MLNLVKLLSNTMQEEKVRALPAGEPLTSLRCALHGRPPTTSQWATRRRSMVAECIRWWPSTTRACFRSHCVGCGACCAVRVHARDKKNGQVMELGLLPLLQSIARHRAAKSESTTKANRQKREAARGKKRSRSRSPPLQERQPESPMSPEA